MPASSASSASPPAALTATPSFAMEDGARVLHTNARFQISLPRAEVNGMTVLYRLRDSLLNLMGHQLHAYGARPGVVAFRETKAKASPAAAAAPQAQPPLGK